MKPWHAPKVACICCREGDPYRVEVPGSVKKQCYNCELTVYASPATVAFLEKEQGEIICVQCHAEYAKLSGRKTFLLPPTPAHAAEGRQQSLSREDFIERYVAVQVRRNGQKDTPELRQKAGEVYDCQPLRRVAADPGQENSGSGQ